MKINIDRFMEAKIGIHKLRCVGGAAKSDTFMQIKTDILGCPLETLTVREAACLGAAMLAAAASGAYSSPLEALAMVHTKRQFEPNPFNVSLYEKKYRIYRMVYDSLKELNHTL